MRRLASYPFLAAFKMFLLPDRHDFLEGIDGETACLERFRAMRRRYRDRHRRLANLHHADPMLVRDSRNPPSLHRFEREFANLRPRHRLVGLVLQPQHLTSDVVLARGADEGANRAGHRIADGGFQSGYIDTIADDPDRTDRRWRIETAADRWDERDLVTRARAIIVVDVFLIDCEADRIAMALECGE